jgi:hypothetical protein
MDYLFTSFESHQSSLLFFSNDELFSNIILLTKRECSPVWIIASLKICKLKSPLKMICHIENILKLI